MTVSVGTGSALCCVAITLKQDGELVTRYNASNVRDRLCIGASP
jgi:hypothetical protein